MVALEVFSVTTEEVKNALKGKSRCTAEDNLTTDLITFASDFVINYLNQIFTKCLRIRRV